MTTKRRKAKKARRFCVWQMGLGGSKYRPGAYAGCEYTWWSDNVKGYFDFCPHCGFPIELKSPKGGRK